MYQHFKTSPSAMSAPRSVFTFESAAHCSHVLSRLDEQRRRDLLCDVTVEVEGRAFRAHRAVLASCSDYFTHRVSSPAQQGATVHLPQEVTAAGFEPLLKFAYTSKLLFGKDDVLEIRNAASVLGFRDLDEACFDFLLPKFFSRNRSSVPLPRKTCCKETLKGSQSPKTDTESLDGKEAKPVADSATRQDVAGPCEKSVSGGKTGSQTTAGGLAPMGEGAVDCFMQCPKYRKFQLACGKDAERSLAVAAAAAAAAAVAIKAECDPCCSAGVTAKSEPEQRNLGGDRAHEPWKCEETEDDAESEDPEKLDDAMATASDQVSSAGAAFSEEASGRRSPGLILHHCPLRALAGGTAMTRSQESFVMDLKDDKGTVEPVSSHRIVEEGEEESGAMDATEAGSAVGSDVGSDTDAGPSSSSDSASGQAASLDWLKPREDPGAGSPCPFLQNLDQSKCLWKGAPLSESEGASHSGVSSFNSGEDGDSETDSDIRERARQVQLPFSVAWIVDLSRNDFQQLLKQQVLTREQLDFVYDMRRRTKNRLAAQRCRKRKLDCIHNLQYEINKLKSEREKLMLEKSHLSQLKVKTCHSVSTLCQRVCSEANLQPQQLQVLARYAAPDCPLTSLLPHVDALLSQAGSPPQGLAGPEGGVARSEGGVASSGGDAD